MNNFYNKVSSRIEDLILAIVALGILVVSIEYVQFFLDHRGNIDVYGFSQRLVLFFAVIVFTSYYFLAYSAYFCCPQVDQSFNGLSARRMIVMYILELVQVTLATLPYAILLIGTLTSAPDKFSSGLTLDKVDISISLDQLALLFIIMSAWHLVAFSWYSISFGDKSDRRLHLIYLVIYLVFYALVQWLGRALEVDIIEWILIVAYLMVVLSLYFTKGVKDLQKLTTESC